MRKISVHVFRQGLAMAYTINRNQARDGWRYSRTIECDERPQRYATEALRLIAGLGRNVFYVPSEATE
jgi:hypothetical protein